MAPPTLFHVVLHTVFSLGWEFEMFGYGYKTEHFLYFFTSHIFPPPYPFVSHIVLELNIFKLNWLISKPAFVFRRCFIKLL